MIAVIWLSPKTAPNLMGEYDTRLSGYGEAIAASLGRSYNLLVPRAPHDVLRLGGTCPNLIAEVQGKVWLIETDGERPSGDIVVVSSVQLDNTTQYRVVGTPDNDQNIVSVKPGLEDG